MENEVGLRDLRNQRINEIVKMESYKKQLLQKIIAKHPEKNTTPAPEDEKERT